MPNKLALQRGNQPKVLLSFDFRELSTSTVNVIFPLCKDCKLDSLLNIAHFVTVNYYTSIRKKSKFCFESVTACSLQVVE